MSAETLHLVSHPNDIIPSLSAMSVNEPPAIIDGGDKASTIYMPIVSPPTPAPSPRPIIAPDASGIAHISRLEFESLKAAGSTVRQQYLAALLADCSPAELLFVSTTIAPLLKRDFLRDLPIELSLHILEYIDDARTLARASRVSRFWNALMRDESSWKRMCDLSGFTDRLYPNSIIPPTISSGYTPTRGASLPVSLSDGVTQAVLMDLPETTPTFSYRRHFIYSYKTMTNWRRKGRLLNKHRPPSATPDGGVVTSVALDHDWIVVGLASCRIQVFSAHTGVLSRTLVGHESGVWAVHLVSAGGSWADPPISTPHHRATDSDTVGTSTDVGAGVWLSEVASKFGEQEGYILGDMEFHIPDSLRVAIGLDKPRSSKRVPAQAKPSDICGSSEGWGNANALVVSGGCDKQLRVWDVRSGYCIYVLEGHTSTIRCLRVLHNRPIAVSGSRDATLRVWDVQRGKLLRTLTGHEESVRCMDVYGNQVVSGSYDANCRVGLRLKLLL